MKRIYLVCVTAALILAGCGQKGATSTATTAGQAGPTAAVPSTAPEQGAPAQNAYPEPGKAAAVITEVVPETTAGYPAPQAGGGQVSIPAVDGSPLAATFAPGGKTGVILAHMFGGSQVDWQPLSADLAAAGYSVLAFDFRGFGNSTGSRNLKVLDEDIQKAADYLRANGAEKIVCIGASMGGTACAVAAAKAGLSGLVVISSPLVMEVPLAVTSDTLAALAMPKLFIAARDDKPYAAEVQQMFDWSGEPRQIELLEGSAHGTNLLQGDQAGVLKTLVLDFLKGIG